jgi:hypothetical protein
VSAVEVTRAQVLAHRVLAQQLHRPAGVGPVDLAVWALGVQDTPAGSATLALAARLPGGIDEVPDLADPARWTSVWATRGAPVVVATDQLDRFARALWPIDAADAVARLAGNGQHLRKVGADPVEALRTTAEVLRRTVTAVMAKGEVSTAVTAAVPDEYVTWCRPCDTHHVGEQLLRLAALPAGVRLVAGASPAVLAPIDGWPGVIAERSGTEDLVAAYLRLHGPATRPVVAAFLGTSGRPITAVWPADLVEVRVDGTRTWLPSDQLDGLLALDGTEAVDVVRLLPRSDPWLLQRDREILVPDAGHRKALWPVLGQPGAVLAGGEVVATWRPKGSGRRLTLTVTPFGPLSSSTRAAIEAEAAHVAAARGADSVTVTVTDH